MTRKQQRYLGAAALGAVIVALGVLVDPTALFAAPFIFGTVADGGDDDPDPDAGDDPEDDDDEPDDPDPGDDDPDGDDPDDDDDDDPDGADARSGKGKDGKNGREKLIPAYRLRQQQERFERLLSEESGKNRQLLERLSAALTGTPQGGTPQLTPQQEKLRKSFLDLFPEFKELLSVAPKAKDLVGLADQAPSWQRDTDEYWNRVARTTSSRLTRQAAEQMGQKKLDGDTESMIRTSFISWVKADRSGERNHRYEGQDETLTTDFLKVFFGRFRTGVQRAGNADALRRHQTQRLPRGGNSSTTVPGVVRKKKKDTDEDPFESVGSRAWNALQDELGGQS